MQKRLVMGALLSVALVGLTGCPPIQVSPGTWLFTIDYEAGDDISVVALILQDGGTTQNPDPRPADVGLFAGTLTWMQNGTIFTMSQVADSDSRVYTGAVNSSTSMEGIWTATAGFVSSGTWSAEKL